MPATQRSASSSCLLFMYAWVWFRWLSSTTETTPSLSHPGGHGQARGVLTTVNKAVGGPLGAAGLPGQAPSPGWPEAGPRSPLLQEARV